MRPAIITLFIIAATFPSVRAQTSHVLGIEGTAFTMDGQPFYYTGVSFFNAIYNPTLNATDASRSTGPRPDTRRSTCGFVVS